MHAIQPLINKIFVQAGLLRPIIVINKSTLAIILERNGLLYCLYNSSWITQT